MPIVEAAYAIDASLQAWMQRLLSVADTYVGWGLGGVAFLFSIGPSGAPQIERESWAMLGPSSKAMDAHWDRLSCCVQASGEVVRCLAVNDEVIVVGLDLDRRGALLSLGSPGIVSFTSAMRADLVRVGTHILTALRLRRRLGLENAWLSTGLPQLTLTERRVVAHAARGLTTKEVAYTLGLRDVTVRVLLMRAARRCGVRSRAELLVLGRQALSAPGGEAEVRPRPRRGLW